MNPFSAFTGALLLATFVEGTVEYFFSEATWAKNYLKYISLVLGVVVALAYNVDILAALGLVAHYAFIGSVVSGIMIGRGGNYLNDFITHFKPADDTAAK